MLKDNRNFQGFALIYDYSPIFNFLQTIYCDQSKTHYLESLKNHPIKISRITVTFDGEPFPLPDTCKRVL